MKLNLGCGSQTPDGWVNVDCAVGAWFAKIPFFRALNRRLHLFTLDWSDKIYLFDVRGTFPWGTSTVDVVYSSHLLEHFSREVGRRFLCECHRVLRRDGILRLVVPDLRHYVSEYVEGRIKADRFLESLDVCCTGGSLKRRYQYHISGAHRCMYDAPCLSASLNEIGFSASARSVFDSDIEDIRQIELAGRAKKAIIVEGRKR